MLILLDIDGVLISAASWKALEDLDDGFPMFTRKSIDAMNKLLVDEPTIILSSSHRDRFPISKWKEIFRNRGLNVMKLDRLGPTEAHSKRKEEILDWFDHRTNTEAFVIIDDDTTLNALPEHLKSHLVLTKALIGLTPEHVPQVEAIVGKG